MADQIVIAELQINTKALQESNTKLIQQIAQLKSEQKDLQTSTNGLTTASDEQSRKFIENDAALKQLNTEYSTNKKVLSEAVTGVAGLNDELQKEAKSVYEATNQNTKLNIIKKQITTSTQEGRAAIEEINVKLDKNTEYIKANSSETEKQKMNIGNYKDSLKGALAELNPFNGGLSGFIERSQSAGGTGKLLTESFKGIMTGVKGATVAAWEFIATPIGAIIAAIVIVATLLYDIFKNFAPVINPIKDAMAALGAVFEVVKTSVFALVTGTKSLGEVFSSFGSEASKAADEAMKLAVAQREITKAGRELELSTAKAQAEITKYLVQAKNRTLSEEERIALLDKAISKEKENVDEKLKQNNREIAAARLKLAEGKEISEEDMVQLAKGNSRYAQLIRDKYGIRQEDIDDLRKKETERYGIIEESSRVEEKAMNQKDKLAENAEKKEQKAQEDAKKAQEDAIQANEKRVNKEIELMKSELSIYIATQNLKNKTVEEELNTAQTVSDKKVAILNKELANKKISQINYDEAIIMNDLETKKKQAEIAVANLEYEANLYKLQHKSRLGDSKTLTEFLVSEEKARLETIYNQEQEANTKRFVNNLISEKEYNLKSIELEQGFEEQKKNLKLQYDQQVKAELALQRQLDLDTRNVELDEQNASQFQKDIDRIAYETEQKLRVVNEAEQADKDRKLADLEAETEAKKARGEFDLQALSDYLDRKNKIETTASAKTQQAITNITRTSAVAQSKIEAAKLNAKLQGYSAVAGGIAQIAGKETAVGKAAAIAQTTISTYQAATAAYAAGSSVGGPAGVVLGPLMAGIAIAAGLANVASIVGVQGADGMASGLSGVASGATAAATASSGEGNIPKAEKGALFKIGGNRHSAGGTKFQGEDGTAFEAEEGELIGVMNRNASRVFMDFNNQYPSNVTTTRPNVFASGGIITQQSVMSSNSNIDIVQMADMIAQANSQIPPPIVYTAVTDINYQQGNYAKVVSGANH